MTHHKFFSYKTAFIKAVFGIALLASSPVLAQVGVSISLGEPVYAPPPPEYIAPAYAPPPVVYGPEYVPDYYDYRHRPHHHPVPHSPPHARGPRHR